MDIVLNGRDDEGNAVSEIVSVGANETVESEHRYSTLTAPEPELATGGVIEPGGIPYVSDDPGQEIMFLPCNAQVYPNPVTVMLSTGWYNGATYQQPQFVPTNTFPTEQDLRAFVEQCTAKYLDEKLDERVSKALDELAREFNENKAFKPNPFYVETPGSEHAV